MENAVYFTLKGFQYRTDGSVVEAKDGKAWNATHSIPVILHARIMFADAANVKRYDVPK